MARSTTSSVYPLYPGLKPIRGFSLIELMVALLLGLIIMGGVMAIFSSTHATHQTETGLARMQENARFVMNIIARETRAAGYMGCLRDTTKIQTSLNNPTDFNNSFGVGVQGFEADGTAPGGATLALPTTVPWTPALDALIPNSANTVAGSDVLVIRKLSGSGFRLTPTYTNAAKVFVETDANTVIKTGDILVATDCERATVFQATNVTLAGGQVNIEHSTAKATPGNSCAKWGQAGCVNLVPYGDGSEIAQAQTIVFYVRQDPGDAMPALFMARFGSGSGALNGLRLADGVESMQVLYGVDSTPLTTNPTTFDRAEQYMTAAQIDTIIGAGGAISWANVVSVRVSLLMRTVNEPGERADQTIDNKPFYDLAGTRIKPPSDRNRRRIFTMTIQLRNRITTEAS